MPTMPHCDPSVLHAPGECKYCDERPDWQEYREMAGIAFTGHEPDRDQTMCPSEIRRGIRQIEQWPGNRKAAPGGD